MHISLAHQGTVVKAMNNAITAILTGAGFDVRDGADDYHWPMSLLVGPRRDVPHWRDPIDPALDGASGFMTGVGVRVRSGELAGAELVVSGVRVDADFRGADLCRRRRRHGHELGLAGSPEGLDANAGPAVRATGRPHGAQDLDQHETTLENTAPQPVTQPAP
ncbi:MAG: hypothetical protein ACYCVZ_02230 [Streptosporangiaceae bacterium]